VTDRVRLLAAQAGLLGLSVTFLIVPASALFLDRYGAAELPFVYLAVAVLGVVVSRVIRAWAPAASILRVSTSSRNRWYWTNRRSPSPSVWLLRNT